jgi:hypothetical protein
MLQSNEHISELVKLRVALLALVAWDERNGIYGKLPPLMLEAKAALALGSSAVATGPRDSRAKRGITRRSPPVAGRPSLA